MSGEKLEASIAKGLKYFRHKKEMSLEDVRLRSGIDRSYISKIENGYIVPRLNMVYRICESLSIDISELINWALKNMHNHDNTKEYSPTEDDIKRLMGEK